MSLHIIVSNIFTTINEWKKDEVTKFEKLFLSPSLSEDIPSGFFDGAQKDGWCGAGKILYLRRHHNIKLKMGIGKGKNTIAGLLSLWACLWFAKKRRFLEIKVYEDSKVIIEWENGLNSMQYLSLSSWMGRVSLLSQHFLSISFRHIYRCFIEEVDALCKAYIREMYRYIYCS